jgi:hypothetical protein
VLGLVLLAIPAAYFYFLGDEAPPPPPPPPKVEEPEPVKPVELKIGAVEGAVEVRRGAGGWKTAQSGDALQAADGVRTGDGARAVLVGGDAYEVKMEPGTAVAVDELTESISRVLLESGMASAKVKGSARHTFEVKAAGSEALARTREGAFTISNNAQGTVAVGTQAGEVEFAGKGKVVIVRAGQQSVVKPGQGPSDPVTVPTSLLLKVRWPTTRELNKKRLVLTGQAEPGAQVEVAGRIIPTDAEGKFVHTLQLAEGRNELSVRARAVGGLAEESHAQVDVDTTPPSMGVDTDIWGTPKP